MALIAVAVAAVALMMWSDAVPADDVSSQTVSTAESDGMEISGDESGGVAEEIDSTLTSNEDFTEDAAQITESEISLNPGLVSDKKPLVGTKWNWRQTNGSGQSMLSSVPDNNPFVLTFSNETSMGSATDCNTMGGSYKVEGNSLVFSDMFSTLMYCENSLEGEYSAQLNEVEKYHIEGTILYLYLKEDKGVMVFEAVE